MHLIFERSRGKFKSNSNILALAWMPYYNETKFRQSLLEYHQRQLINLTGPTVSVPTGSTNRAHDSPQTDQSSGSGREPYGAISRNLSNSGRSQESQPTDNLNPANLGSITLLNSRIGELFQRYAYLKTSAPSVLSSEGPSSLGLEELGSSIDQKLEAKFGRIPGFGWLVIGNIGRIVGITLTSTELPLQEKSPNGWRSNMNDGDLIAFQESNLSLSDRPNTRQQECNREQVPRRVIPQDQMRPDKKSMRTNYNLRGHLDEVILVKWNELYQKLATVDSKGNVLIWCKINEKFTIQTPFYNRTKSVADFKWSHDGKTALICYTDSFILVGSSTSQRHWHSMLNLDDYHITCASWTPNDEQLLLGVSNGNIVVIDLPHSELTEVVVDRTNIRTMGWSSCDMGLKDVCRSKKAPIGDTQVAWRGSAIRTLGTTNVVNHRRLSRDCSVFSRYRFCSQGANITTRRSESPRRDELIENERSQLSSNDGLKQHNILAIDFANSTIKLYNGGLEDREPKLIQVNLESYIMQWSSDGSTLAVAGFNIHTTAPSIGCLKCYYLNTIKFYNQNGQLIYEQMLRYKRYPITAFAWGHEDSRLFLATGPRLHCAKVYFGIQPLGLLAASCFQRYTKLPNKSEIIESISRNRLNLGALDWQSSNCPISVDDLRAQKTLENRGSLGSPCPMPTRFNNSYIYQFQLPSKLQKRVDELFALTIRKPMDERWSPSDIIWHVPKHDQRYHCTLVCYTSDQELASPECQYRAPTIEKMDANHTSDQNKIFVLYVEFQGSLIPILRARRVGFLKPEFVIFDPEDGRPKAQRLRKVSDVSQQQVFNKRQIENLLVNPIQTQTASVYAPHSNDGFTENCSDLHLYMDPRASSSSLGPQSLSDAEQYYNFECDTTNRQKQERLVGSAIGRTHHQEPVALHLASNPYLLYMMSMSAGHNLMQNSGHHLHDMMPTSMSADRRKDRNKSRSSSFTNNLTEQNELVRIKSNIWGTKFKLLNSGNHMIRQRSILGSVIYKASILHLQPRQIFLTIKDMSNYCCLCSQHHHSKLIRANQAKVGQPGNEISLLDLPNVDFKPVATMANVHKEAKSETDKVVISVGDSIRIAPSLSGNERYKYAGSSTHDQQQPSTSKVMRNVGPQRAKHDCTLDLAKNRHPSGDVTSNVHELKAGKPYSTSHSALGRRTNSLSETPGSESRRCRQSAKATRRYGDKATNGGQDDDILTLSLGTDDRVRVEMSLMDNLSPKESDSHNQGGKSQGSQNMNDFLAENRTLKSIQTITKMIIDLSSKANSMNEEFDECEQSSPSKVAKTSNNPDRSIAARYVAPETPVHRPRRIASRNVRNIADSGIVLHTQSANSTPLKGTVPRTRRRRVERDVEAPIMQPLPPVPPSVPLRRRLSSSARRFLDGSLRSLYTGSGYSTCSDLESDESEPLVSSRKRGGNLRGLDRSLIGQSQPCSPAKSLAKRTNDPITMRAQLLQRLRGRSVDRASSSTSDDANKLRSKGMRALDRASVLDPQSRSSSDGSSLSDLSSDESCSLDSELSFPNSRGAPKGSIKRRRRAGKLDFSTSTKDLRELDKFEGDRTGTEQGHKLTRKRRTRQRRKSICYNSNCCCAREFKLTNRPPVWNELSQVYQLDFGGRVTQESAKNLQIEFEGQLVSSLSVSSRLKFRKTMAHEWRRERQSTKPLLVKLYRAFALTLPESFPLVPFT